MKTEGTKVEAGEQPNNEQDTNQEDRETKYKKLQSDTERGVQKVIAEKKELENYITTFKKEVGKVAKDPSNLITVYDENEKMAKDILEQYYDGISIDEFIEQYLDGKRPAKKVDYDKLKEKAKEEARKEIESEEAQNYLKSKLKDFTAEEQEEILGEREDFTRGRHINKEFVKKYLPKFIPDVKEKDEDVDVMKSTAKGSGSASKEKISDAKKSAKAYYQAKRGNKKK